MTYLTQLYFIGTPFSVMKLTLLICVCHWFCSVLVHACMPPWEDTSFPTDLVHAPSLYQRDDKEGTDA